MAFPGPRREREQYTGSGTRGDRVAFRGIETEELTGAGVDRLRGRLDPHLATDDEQQCGLSHLMLAQLLSGRKLDQHHAALSVLRVQYSR